MTEEERKNYLDAACKIIATATGLSDDEFDIGFSDSDGKAPIGTIHVVGTFPILAPGQAIFYEGSMPNNPNDAIRRGVKLGFEQLIEFCRDQIVMMDEVAEKEKAEVNHAG